MICGRGSDNAPGMSARLRDGNACLKDEELLENTEVDLCLRLHASPFVHVGQQRREHQQEKPQYEACVT